MKSLSTLIKLQKTRVDEQRLMLAKLQAQVEETIQAIAALEIRKTAEQLAAQEHTEARTTYGAYLKETVKQGRELEKQRRIGEAAIDAARLRLTELFEEQKRYEIAEAARIEAAKKEELRKETQELDEIGSISFTRKKN